ncbi:MULTISPECIES: glucosamine-6-phosphate deaminase [Kocuria]|uniref:Glucosamine-6-phosphate deaminase n=1 Tax=Kocuria rosea subsp. polaris TaxID=136273 RepID=A0A0W8INL7_KOCRO|nr:glucosamine-6-phosphate deaminase [Kocuria polaris]KUG61565.1 glucosamine-6-phosphate deaminase [Kocuria polaris]
MEVLVLPTADDVAARAADVVGDQVSRRQDTVLGVATGSSPLGTYRELARRQAHGLLDLTRLSCFALDEYVGLPAGHPAGYAAVLERELARPLGLPPSRVRVPDGSREDLEAACHDYEEDVAGAGGIDLQILGIGANGHIGFNEPGSSLSSRTRVKALAARTRADNARFFETPDDVPTHCVTQGLGTILDARRVLLVAQGERKATAVAAAVEGPVSAMCPGSVLQFHRSVTVVVDEAAAGRLALTDYYRFVAEAGHRPPREQR